MEAYSRRINEFRPINTSGDTYDIYVEIGNYATSVNIHWDCTTNASVSIYTSPTYSASKPSSVTDGVVYTMYSSHQKPTPSDIGALPTTGGLFQVRCLLLMGSPGH